MNQLIILRTRLNPVQYRYLLEPYLRKKRGVLKWTVDWEDRDRVLRLEVAPSINEQELTQKLIKIGISNEPLED